MTLMSMALTDRTAAPGSENPRLMRYAAVTLESVRVRRAVTEDDFEVVASLRRAGFSRVMNGHPDTVAWIDDVDRTPGTFSLIASIDDQDVGTLRVQDGRMTPVELTRFVDFMPLLRPEEKPVAQFARLSMLKTPRSPEAMFGLFKAAWHWCYRQGHGGIVIATPVWSKPIYDFMVFRPLGPEAQFTHPFARQATHYTMVLQAKNAEDVWRACRHPLCEQFCDIEHLDLLLDMPDLNGV